MTSPVEPTADERALAIQMASALKTQFDAFLFVGFTEAQASAIIGQILASAFIAGQLGNQGEGS